MQLLQKSLDIEEELEVLDEREREFEADIDERVDRALDIDPAETEEEEAEIQSLEQEVAELEAQLVAVKGYREALERAIEQWDGTELQIRELSGAETRVVKTEAERKANELGTDYTDDFHETEFLQRAVQSTPPGAPDPDNIGDLPDRMFEWVLTRANMLNSTGEFDVGNSSLRERMVARKRESESTESS